MIFFMKTAYLDLKHNMAFFPDLGSCMVMGRQTSRKTMRTIEHRNIPYRTGGGQVLIQVQLIHSLPFATTMKKNKNPTTTTKKKIPYPA